MHLVPPPKNILHNHRVRFLMGRLLYRGEIGNNGSITVYVKMLNALSEHLLRKTLSYIYIYIFPFFVLTTNICNILVQPLLICSSLKTDACKSSLAQNLASLYYLFHFSFSSFKTTLLQTGVRL